MSEQTSYQDNHLSDVAKVFRAMPSRFKAGVAPREISYYFTIGEEDWTVLIGPATCEVSAGKSVESADCFLKTSPEIFLGTIKGEYTPSFMDIMSGKIKTNNPALLQTFKDVFAD